MPRGAKREFSLFLITVIRTSLFASQAAACVPALFAPAISFFFFFQWTHGAARLKMVSWTFLKKNKIKQNPNCVRFELL